MEINGRAPSNAEKGPHGEEGPSADVHPVFVKLQSEDAKAAFKELYQRTKLVGTLDGNKKALPPLDLNDPSIYATPYPEQNFCKPVGFVSLNRSFLPLQTKKLLQQRKHAVHNLPLTAVEEKIVAMVALQEELHKIVSDVATSKLFLLIHDRAAIAKVVCNGKVACTDAELQKAWRAEVPNREVAKKYYYIYYALKDEPETWIRLIFQVAIELKIWCPVIDKRLDFCARGKKDVGIKSHALASIVTSKLRDSYRNPIFRNPPHGISITITNADRKCRRKKEFDWDVNVVGWGSKKHKDFVEESNPGETQPETVAPIQGQPKRALIQLASAAVVPTRNGHRATSAAAVVPMTDLVPALPTMTPFVIPPPHQPLPLHHDDDGSFSLGSSTQPGNYDWLQEPPDPQQHKNNADQPGVSVPASIDIRGPSQVAKTAQELSLAQKLEDTQKKLEEVSQQKAAAERNVKYLQKNNAAGGLPLKEASSVITKANQAAQKVNAAVATTTNKRTLPGKGKNGAGNKKGQKKKAVPAAAPEKLPFDHPTVPKDNYEPIEIVGFSGIYRDDDVPTLHVCYESRDPRFEDYDLPNVAVTEVHEDCENDIEVNLVEVYVKKVDNRNLYQAVCRALKRPVREVFPEAYEKYFDSKNSPGNRTKQVVTCNYDHSTIDPTNYTPVPHACQFAPGDKYTRPNAATLCSHCKTEIPSTGPTKPSYSKPVWVCKSLDKYIECDGDTCFGTGIVCHCCQKKYLVDSVAPNCSSPQRKRQRRGRKALGVA